MPSTRSSLVLSASMALVAASLPAAAQTFGNTSEFSSSIASTAASCNVVKNTSNSGAGSLREAINCANADTAVDLIAFDIPMSDTGCNAGTGICTISPTSVLTNLNDDGIVIDGFTQTGASLGDLMAGTPHVIKVEIDMSTITYGLSSDTAFNARGNDQAIRGLAIGGLEANHETSALEVNNNSANFLLEGVYVGLRADGTTAWPVQNFGIYLPSNPESAVIRNSIVSNCIDDGIHLTGGTTARTASLTMDGNMIGTDATGMVAHPGSEYGLYANIYLTSVVSNITLTNNLFSGNGRPGFRIAGSAPVDNVVIKGNIVGLNRTQTAKLPNQSAGASLWNVRNSTIGGLSAGDENVFSGNKNSGLSISGTETENLLVLGNSFGLNNAGTAEFGNGSDGLNIFSDVINLTIGNGTNAGTNYLSGNGRHGMSIGNIATGTIAINGNFFGTGSDGVTPFGNAEDGVIWDPKNSQGITLVNNVLSANGGNGIAVDDYYSSFGGAFPAQEPITKNLIGVGVDGTTSLPNLGHGIYLQRAKNLTIGGAFATDGNVIANNAQDGIRIELESDNIIIEGNRIGVNNAADTDYGNGQNGININDSTNISVGQGDAARYNVISGNGQTGVLVTNTGSSGIQINGNRIGTTGNGLTAMPNLVGVDSQAPAVDINSNIISGNTDAGVIARSTANVASPVLVRGNTIGGKLDGTAGLGNGGAGISFSGHIQIEDNVIVSNTESGIHTQGDNTYSATITANKIGVLANGTTAAGNSGRGILVESMEFPTAPMMIGGTGAGDGNIIAHHTMDGIELGGNSYEFSVLGNTIFSNGGLAIDLGPDGVTANDTDDADSGPNNLMNAPVISTISADGTVNMGYAMALDTPAGQYRIEFYRDNVSGDTHGEGHEYLGHVDVTTTGAAGDETFSGTLTALANISAGDKIGATATFFTP